MSKIKIIFDIKDPESVKKAFDAISILNENGISDIAHLPIVQEKAGEWRDAQNKKLSRISKWKIGAIMVRGKQCRYNDVVYNVVQGHTVNNPTHTPDAVPALYRPAPTVEDGQRYPSWDSIGLLDSENFWKEGEQVYHNGKEWISKNAVNIWEPGVVGSNIWEEIGGEFITEPEPEPWVQPAGAHDAYAIGDRATYNGQTWENTSAANVYAPGVFGWITV